MDSRTSPRSGQCSHTHFCQESTLSLSRPVVMKVEWGTVGLYAKWGQQCASGRGGAVQQVQFAASFSGVNIPTHVKFKLSMVYPLAHNIAEYLATSSHESALAGSSMSLLGGVGCGGGGPQALFSPRTPP